MKKLQNKCSDVPLLSLSASPQKHKCGVTASRGGGCHTRTDESEIYLSGSDERRRFGECDQKSIFRSNARIFRTVLKFEAASEQLQQISEWPLIRLFVLLLFTAKVIFTYFIYPKDWNENLHPDPFLRDCFFVWFLIKIWNSGNNDHICICRCSENFNGAL